MKKAVATIMILFALIVLQYYGFVRPIITTSVPSFIQATQGSDFGYYLQSFGDVMFSISIIFLCFGIIWVGIDMAVSKEKEFKLVISKNTLVFLSVGGGLFFGSEFAQAFSRLFQLQLIDAFIYALMTIAALEFTLTTLRYLKLESKRYFITVKVSDR